MQTGTKISAIAHVTLVGWALFGGTFRSEPLPFEVQDVSVISAEEFAVLNAPQQAPDVTDVPADLREPQPSEETAAIPQPVEPEPEQSQPELPDRPVEEPEPDPVLETPDPDVIEDVPTLEPPEPDVIALPVPPGRRPEPRPVDRVAPQPIAAPPPDVKPDDVETPPVSTEEGAEEQQEEQERTAPEEAADRIVTEAEQTPDLAPERSPRPPVRRKPQPRETETAETAEPKPSQETAIDDALKDVLAGAQAQDSTPAPTGRPLTGVEKDALRVAVSNCWNVGSLSTDALKTTVIVAVSMNPDGTPVNESIRLLDSSGGSSGAAQQAFGAARRAIIRCGAKGYDLPADKYGQWQNIEMTFNPERMRIK